MFILFAIIIAGLIPLLALSIEPPPPPPEIIEVKFQYKEKLTDSTWQTLHTVWTTKQTGFFRTRIEK